MTDAEVMTTAILAALDYGGNLEKAHDMLKREGYIPNMLEKSRFNHRQPHNAHLYLTLFSLLSETWKQLNSNSFYVIDCFPVAACDNNRIRRCWLPGRGLPGLPIQYEMIFLYDENLSDDHRDWATVVFFLTSGSSSNFSTLKLYDFYLPQGARFIGDKAYNDYDVEMSSTKLSSPFYLRKRN